MTRYEAQQIVQTLATCFPAQRWEPLTLDAYARRIVDLPTQATAEAVEILAAGWSPSRAGAPSIAELRAEASRVIERQTPFLPLLEGPRPEHGAVSVGMEALANVLAELKARGVVPPLKTRVEAESY